MNIDMIDNRLLACFSQTWEDSEELAKVFEEAKTSSARGDGVTKDSGHVLICVNRWVTCTGQSRHVRDDSVVFDNYIVMFV